MSFEKFLRGSARYRRFVGDGAEREHEAEYENYYLSGVRITETFAADPENRKSGKTVLYFFPSVSCCTDEDGNCVALPRCKNGDICIIGERKLRVAEAKYFGNSGDSLCHVRLTLI